MYGCCHTRASLPSLGSGPVEALLRSPCYAVLCEEEQTHGQVEMLEGTRAALLCSPRLVDWPE